jgi:hypothetical protein
VNFVGCDTVHNGSFILCGKTKRGACSSSATAARRLTPCGLVLVGEVMSRDESREMTWCIR